MPQPGAGRSAAAHPVAVARSLHARPHERCAVLRQAGRDRRGDGRRHRERGGRVQQRPASPTATSCSATPAGRRMRSRTAQGLRKLDPAVAPISTALGVLGMPGMTAYTGLLEIGKPQAGRDRGGRGRVRRGRLAGRADRQDQGRARGRHRRRAATSAATSRTSSASTTASIIARPTSRSGSRPPARTASTSISRMSAAPVFEAVFPLLNPFARVPVCGLISQYNAAAPPPAPIAVPAADARDADQAADLPRLHRQRLRRPPRRLPARHVATGCGKAASSIARTWSRAWRRRRRR